MSFYERAVGRHDTRLQLQRVQDDMQKKSSSKTVRMHTAFLPLSGYIVQYYFIKYKIIDFLTHDCAAIPQILIRLGAGIIVATICISCSVVMTHLPR